MSLSQILTVLCRWCEDCWGVWSREPSFNWSQGLAQSPGPALAGHGVLIGHLKQLYLAISMSILYPGILNPLGGAGWGACPQGRSWWVHHEMNNRLSLFASCQGGSSSMAWAPCTAGGRPLSSLRTM